MIHLDDDRLNLFSLCVHLCTRIPNGSKRFVGLSDYTTEYYVIAYGTVQYKRAANKHTRCVPNNLFWTLFYGHAQNEQKRLYNYM